MSRPFFQDSQFNDFLFASIGDEGAQMPLSVLSAFARLGVDPWQEAAQLSQLTEDLATQNLASIIAALPNGRWAPSEAPAIAARLLRLLPLRDPSNNLESADNDGWLSRLTHVWT